jgi:hypothetical protein
MARKTKFVRRVEGGGDPNSRPDCTDGQYYEPPACTWRFTVRRVHVCIQSQVGILRTVQHISLAVVTQYPENVFRFDAVGCTRGIARRTKPVGHNTPNAPIQ